MKYNTIDELRKDWPEIPIGKAENLSGNMEMWVPLQ